MSIYTGHTIDSGASKSEEDLIYKPLTFENELFTAPVYKRNYRPTALQRLFKGIEQKTSDTTRSPPVAQEIGEDSDGSEADSITIREPGPTPNEARVITSRRPKGQQAGDGDTIGALNTSPNAKPPISFVDACAQGYVEIVELFLQSGQDVHAQFLVTEKLYFLDYSAIHIAAMGGHVQVVEILLSYGADKEMPSRASRKRPLHLAVEAGHVAMVRYFLDKGSDIAASDGASAQAIHYAAGCGFMEMLSFLLGRGATISSTTIEGAQPLHVASQNPDGANIIKFLCRQGADIEAKAHHGITPLYYASLHNNVENMKALLEAGAAHSPPGPSILGIALGRGCLEATRLLLERGMDPNHPVSGGRTALHSLLSDNTETDIYQYRFPTDAEIMELLLAYGADVNLQDLNGNTPLHCLCSHSEIDRRRGLPIEQQNQQIQLVGTLLRNMGDIDTINSAGETATGLSIERGKGDWLSQLLIGSGARLLLSKPSIRISLDFDDFFHMHKPLFTYHVWQGYNTFTKRLRLYAKDPQGNMMIIPERPMSVLRYLLQDPGLVDLNDDFWYDDDELENPFTHVEWEAFSARSIVHKEELNRRGAPWPRAVPGPVPWDIAAYEESIHGEIRVIHINR